MPYLQICSSRESATVQATVFSNSFSISLRYVFKFFRKTPWYASHREVNCSKFLRSQQDNIFFKNLRYVHHTAETNCTPRSRNRNLRLPLVAFKGTVRGNPFMGEHIYYERKDLKYVDLLITFVCTPKQLCDQISPRNRKIIRKHFSRFFRWV